MITPCLPPEQIAENFREQLIETTRRWLALRKEFPECYIRFRRAAPLRSRSPSKDMAVLFLKERGKEPFVDVIPYASIESLAASVSDAEVFAELDRRVARFIGEDLDDDKDA